MNKTMIYGMLTALFALASCMGNGNPVSLSDLEGEWNVVELAGQSVNTKQQPFIGFDTREMRVYGYGGCNRLMGSYSCSNIQPVSCPRQPFIQQKVLLRHVCFIHSLSTDLWIL